MPTPRFTALLPGRAIVLGASMAGLLAARVLQERFEEVLVLERDLLPAEALPRKGTPQVLHAHGLLARGREVIEALFPGFTEALAAQGGMVRDMQANAPFVAGGRRFACRPCGRAGLAASRPAIEAELRRRVRALPRVRIVENVDVVRPIVEEGRVAAVRVLHRADGRDEVLASGLVVDCTGRGSHAPAWLQAWGYDAPEEERVRVDIGYATAYLRREDWHAPDIAALIFAALPGQPRGGVLLAQEPDGEGPARWVVTLAGYGQDQPEPTIEGMRRRARAMGDAALVRILDEAELLGTVTGFAFPHSQRRRFERLSRFPQNFLVMGDALASFNPVYGQGMTVAACEALALRTAMERGVEGVAQRFFPAAARTIDVPWQTAVGADLALPCVQGERTRAIRFVNAYLSRLMRAATCDAAVALAFTEVAHLVAAPPRLFAPNIVARVLWHSGAKPAPLRAAEILP
ncbi:NAD(P)/FAD-dependent oxidoreductase [Variovorax sp. OV329]|uniref:FAD-dependent oxidoreductase n=1 Tax=Variovorax sp. OV329 TaxID=1882825 RepID=UPI0008E04323|nr:FAD-dependent monooxygenase [Variovorax sp. OV329]SFN17770.1 2-polyprenyl-6-methoxyphenol hydroxylase [Variovorax sp. OV329]